VTRTADPQRLDELVVLSLELGDPARDLAILAEGNTSARIDANSFWVKASGTSLSRAEHPDEAVMCGPRPLIVEYGRPRPRTRPGRVRRPARVRRPPR
jgi:rhamnose utilization protein RhaD (predicted bifunctional aldolase and dehydrogenase)